MKLGKRLLSAALSTILLLSAMAPASAAEPALGDGDGSTAETALIGDVNADGAVDTTDARLVLQHAVGKSVLKEDEQMMADVNGDGWVDTTDARLILQYAVGKIVSFPLESTEKPQPILDPVTAERIRQTYLKEILCRYHPEATLDDITIFKYYGTYKDCSAVMITDTFSEYSAVCEDEEIGKIVFHYRDGNRLFIWRDGTFYSLQSAYEQKLLSLTDLENIAYYQNKN